MLIGLNPVPTYESYYHHIYLKINLGLRKGSVRDAAEAMVGGATFHTITVFHQ